MEKLEFGKEKQRLERTMDIIKQILQDETWDLGGFNFNALKTTLPFATFSIFDDLTKPLKKSLRKKWANDLDLIWGMTKKKCIKKS